MLLLIAAARPQQSHHDLIGQDFVVYIQSQALPQLVVKIG